MRDAVSSLTATALIQASNIVSGVLLARFLQPDGRGELAAVMLWPSVIAAVGIFGLHEAIAYHAARRRHGSGRILAGGLLLGGLLSLLLLPIGALVVDILFDGKPAEVREAGFLYLAFIPLNFLGLFLVAMFQGGLRFAEWNLLRTSVHVFYLLLIPAMYLAGFGGVLGFAVASLLANAAMILLALLLYRRVGWAAEEDATAPSTLRALARYGASVHLGAAVAIVAERLDQMIIAIFLSAADLGLFVIATTVARLPLVLASTLATVAFPKIAGAADAAARAAIFGRYSRAASLTILPMALALAAVTPWLLPFFFGAAFADAVPVAWMLTAAAVPLSLKAMLSAGLKACDKGWIVGQAEIATLALSAAFLAALVPSYGLMGAAAAGLLAQGGALAFMLFRVRHSVGIGPRDLLLPGRADLAVIGDMLATLKGRVAGRTGGAG
jgi:O-antigen/teichoic acid export membrane protein